MRASNPTSAIKGNSPAAIIGLAVFIRETEIRNQVAPPAKGSAKASCLPQAALVVGDPTAPKAAGRLMRGPSFRGRAAAAGHARIAVETSARLSRRGTSSPTDRASRKAAIADTILAEGIAPFTCAAGMAGRQSITIAARKGFCETRREITRNGRKGRSPAVWSVICQKVMSARPKRQTTAIRREGEVAQGLISNVFI